jgi:glutathione reductase (NADPH)
VAVRHEKKGMTMAAEHFDLIVIGAGSGGLGTALRAAKYGVRVALLEPRELGGTCVNVGCIPKKAMWYAAQVAEAQQLAVDYGFAGTPGALDWPTFIERRQGYIERIHESYKRNLEQHGVTVIRAIGRLNAAHEVEAAGRQLHAPHIVIATGGRPHRLDTPGFEVGMDSDGFFDLRACPARTAIVGGGYIAVELAGVLRALGGEVDMYVRGRLMGDFDVEMADHLGETMLANGIRIHYQCQITAARRHGKDILLDCDEGTHPGPFDALIWAVGRDPNSDGAGFEQVGIDTDPAGHIVTDAWQNTSVEGIYAIGDITARKALTPVAVAAGRCLADRLFGGKPQAKIDYELIPSVVFSHPPLASVGLSEEDARLQHGDEEVHIFRQAFTPMQLSLSSHAAKTLMKLVCVGNDDRIVGMHILGPGADEMMQGFAVAVKMGARKADLDATVAIHPTSAEEMVLLGARTR